MVHHVLLSRVRRAQPGTAVGPCPGRRLDVAELSRNASLHTPYHTWLLLPRLACGTVPSPRLLVVRKRPVVHGTPLLRQYWGCRVYKPLAPCKSWARPLLHERRRGTGRANCAYSSYGKR